MCAQYLLNTWASELCRLYGIPHSEDQALELRILPSLYSIVVTGTENKRQFNKMSYGLVPSWSQEAKPKFATYNARIESVLEKPTWKTPFLKQRCLVPIGEFIESVYDGNFAGNLIRFSEVKDRILTAAGVWDVWKNPVTQTNHYSFAILTQEPSAFILDAGHDRSPIFLKPESWDDWLNPNNQDANNLMSLI